MKERKKNKSKKKEYYIGIEAFRELVKKILKY